MAGQTHVRNMLRPFAILLPTWCRGSGDWGPDLGFVGSTLAPGTRWITDAANLDSIWLCLRTQEMGTMMPEVKSMFDMVLRITHTIVSGTVGWLEDSHSNHADQGVPLTGGFAGGPSTACNGNTTSYSPCVYAYMQWTWMLERNFMKKHVSIHHFLTYMFSYCQLEIAIHMCYTADFSSSFGSHQSRKMTEGGGGGGSRQETRPR